MLERADPLPLDYGDSSSLNRDFHVAVAEASQNAVLVDLLVPLVDVHFDNIGRHFTEEICRRTWDAHKAIYQAVAKHDVAAAERAMRAHFTIGPIAVETETDKHPRRAAGRSQPRPRPRR